MFLDPGDVRLDRGRLPQRPQQLPDAGEVIHVREEIGDAPLGLTIHPDFEVDHFVRVVDFVLACGIVVLRDKVVLERHGGIIAAGQDAEPPRCIPPGDAERAI